MYYLSNVVNSKIAKFGKQHAHWVTNQSLSGKIIKIENERGV